MSQTIDIKELPWLHNVSDEDRILMTEAADEHRGKVITMKTFKDKVLLPLLGQGGTGNLSLIPLKSITEYEAIVHKNNNTMYAILDGNKIIKMYIGTTLLATGGGKLSEIEDMAPDVDEPNTTNEPLALMQEPGKKEWVKATLEYVSRKYDDTVQGIIKFMKDIYFGEFKKGNSGAGIYQDSEGHWHIESDYGHFRRKWIANDLEIQKVSHIGGKQVSTGAEMISSRIEDKGTSWRCYFVKEDADGNEVSNQFVVNDFAFFETFNVKRQPDGSIGNRRYWRKVVGTGEDYIDLSKSLCLTGSHDPREGDNIIQLGHSGNDVSRQGAIIQASAGDASPYFNIYSGIKTFILPEPDVTLSPHGTKIKAKSILLENTGQKLDHYLEGLATDVNAVKKQADGMWVLWFSEEVPTLSNYPAIEWDKDEIREQHLQDVAVIDNPSDDRNNGRAWRFHKSDSGVYSWTEITDKYLLDALNIAIEGRDKAKEKCRNFVIQPTVADAYDVGDTWSNATWNNADGTYLYNDDYLVATSDKAAGKPFSIAHWKPVNKATTSFLEMLPDQIMLGVAPSLEEAKKVADQAISDANNAYNEAAKALGLANDVDGREKNTSKSVSILRTDVNNITATVGKIGFDSNGKITTINTSGLVTTGEFNSLLSKKVTFDNEGKITNINKAGLVTTSEGNSLWASKKMESGKEIISSINQTAEAVTIDASKINLNGKVTINSLNSDLQGKINEKVDKSTIIDGDHIKTSLINTDEIVARNIEATTGKVGYFSINNEGLYYGSPSKWSDNNYKQNLSSITPGLIRLQRQISVPSFGTIANVKVGIGDGADPSSTGDSLCDCAGYFYRNMNAYSNDYYKPAVKIISDNVANRDVALYTKGAIVCHGGLVSAGHFNNANDVTVLDFSFGTTVLIANSVHRYVYLPTLSNMKQLLNTTTRFIVPVRLVAQYNNSKSYVVAFQDNQTSLYFRNYNGGKHGESIEMGSGDILELLLIWDGTNYYAQMMNRSY